MSEYLASIGRLGEDCNNGLSGQLNFGSEDDIEHQLSISGNELSYAAEVWHFASWGPLAEFLKTKFGAGRVWCGSEEEGVSLDSLRTEMEHESFKELVRALLESLGLPVPEGGEVNQEFLKTLLKSHPQKEQAIKTALTVIGKRKINL